MRQFDYKKDYELINTIIKGYIKSLKKELILLKSYEGDKEYQEALNIIQDFENKYPDLTKIYERVLEDLISPYCVEYCFEHQKYPEDASVTGQNFENDIKKIILLEENLKELAIKKWKASMTNYDEIVNGEEFMVVGHASFLMPGVDTDDNRDKNNINRQQYLSCSFVSNKELNTFQNIKTFYIIEPNESNYISASYTDSVTSDYSTPSFLTLKTINVFGKLHHIKVGYSTDYNECVTTILTPKLIEMLSIKREVEENGEMYSYKKSQTNEIVFDRTNIKIKGVLLISNGCDILFGEYLRLKQNNQPFKCINKGLYREKNGQKPYTIEEYNEFIKKLNDLEKLIEENKEFIDLLSLYYNEVVLNMGYSKEILDLINDKFSKYIDINKGLS